MRTRFTPLLALTALLAAPAPAFSHDLSCELGQTLSIAGNLLLDEAVILGWKGKIYRMMRVGTSTGAQRFEDRASGLILISIPSKAMLLDGRRGEPVANECRTGHGGRSAR